MTNVINVTISAMQFLTQEKLNSWIIFVTKESRILIANEIGENFLLATMPNYTVWKLNNNMKVGM